MTYREIRGMCLRRYSRHTVREALRFLHFMQLCPSILCHGAMKRAMLAFLVSNICCFVTRRREFIWCIAQSAKEGARGAVPLIMYRGKEQMLGQNAMKAAMQAFFVSNICYFVTRRREFMRFIAQTAQQIARGAVPLIMCCGIRGDAWQFYQAF